MGAFTQVQMQGGNGVPDLDVRDDCVESRTKVDEWFSVVWVAMAIASSVD